MLLYRWLCTWIFNKSLNRAIAWYNQRMSSAEDLCCHFFLITLKFILWTECMFFRYFRMKKNILGWCWKNWWKLERQKCVQIYTSISIRTNYCLSMMKKKFRTIKPLLHGEHDSAIPSCFLSMVTITRSLW